MGSFPVGSFRGSDGEELEQELTEARIPEGHLCLGPALCRQGARREGRCCWVRSGHVGVWGRNGAKIPREPHSSQSQNSSPW